MANEDTESISLNKIDQAVEAYKRLLIYQFGGALLFVIVLCVALWFSFHIAQSKPPLLILIMLCGMLGAFFSALTRLYSIHDLHHPIVPPLVTKLGIGHLWIYALVPPVVGSIAAVVIYLAFAGDVLQGVIFPKIACKDKAQCGDLYGLVHNFVPSEPVDYAKALIWAFIAGFSERLVPDTLHMLASKQNKIKE